MATTDSVRRDLARRQQTQPQQGAPATIRQLIEAQKTEIAKALPKHMDADRLARIALTVIKQTPKLAECTPDSLLGAVMTCAQLGLEPGPTGEAYLVPYGNTVTFIPGYRGLIKLAWQSGMLASIKAETVYEHDEFDVSFGLDGTIAHRPPKDWPRPGVERGNAIAYYAIAKLHNGGTTWWVMSRDDIERIRERSRAKDNGPWRTDYDAMARKTVIRQLMKYLPLSPEVATALAHDESVRTDPASDLVDVAPTYIDGEVVDEQPAGDSQTEPADWPEVAQPGGQS